MVDTFLLSPPVAIAVFLLLAYGLYRLGGVLAPDLSSHPSDDAHPDKHLTYAAVGVALSRRRALGLSCFLPAGAALRVAPRRRVGALYVAQ